MKSVTCKSSLPIDAILSDITSSLERNPNLVVEAAPGAGKTTRVPVALLEIVRGEVIVLEPRRIAARLAARRVASEMGEPIGGTVGYQVRFEEVAGPNTRLRFVTEGVLTRRLLADPNLKSVDAVVLDEFHERHLESDLALALLKHLQLRRPELRIVVMSATLDAAPIAKYLGDCPVLRSEGRSFELRVQHLPYSPHPLQVQVRNAIELLVREKHSGNVLVFLPGLSEIRRTMRECEAIARQGGFLMLALYGGLSPEEQDRVVAPAPQRKLILATNVAESSVTVEGVTAVIDSGLARFASDSTWTGLPTLHVGRISKASAKQRAGRAGRTEAGRALRLYPEEDYRSRAEHDTPEILRSELSQLCLVLRAMRIGGFTSISWLDAPPLMAIERAESLLERLGATGDMEHRMLQYPLPPRLSRILIESIERGVGEDGCVAVALLSSGVVVAKNDLLAAMEAPPDSRTLQHLQQLRKIARLSGQSKHDDDALLMCMLVGFPDRVARLKAERQVMMSAGVSAEVEGDRPQYEFMVAIDAEDRKDKPLPLIRMTSRIEPEWLIDLFPDHVRELSMLNWNRVAERVDAVSTLLYDEVVLGESHDASPDAGAVAQLLAQKAIEVGINRFVDGEALENFKARIAFAGLEEPDISHAFLELSFGIRSFAELDLAAKGFIAMLEHRMDAKGLREIAPQSIRLQSGRQTKIHYEDGKTPWISSRLQDFFGMKETPRIGATRVPVVVHLLAPNQRAVQTTTDLAGFWDRLYPQVRRELMRRYPRHAWPERP